MAQTAFKIVNLRQFTNRMRARLRRLEKRGARGGPFDRSVIFVKGWIQRNFKSDGRLAEGGSGWQPLAPSTKKARERGWGYYKPATENPQILRHKGFLMRRWKHDYNDRRAVVENFATNKGFYYGTAHDKGTGNVPKRQILPRKEQIAGDIKKIFGTWVRTSLR